MHDVQRTKGRACKTVKHNSTLIADAPTRNLRHPEDVAEREAEERRESARMVPVMATVSKTCRKDTLLIMKMFLLNQSTYMASTEM